MNDMKVIYSRKLNLMKEYPFSKINKKVKELRERGMEVIDFGVGDPTSSTPKFIIDSTSKSLDYHKYSGYPSFSGCDLFRSSCSEYLERKYSIKMDPESEIASTIGSKEAIFNFPLGFINEGDIAICPTPAYPVYKIGTVFSGGIPFLVPLIEKNKFLINFDDIPEDIAKKSKLIWINYPNSPTGVTAPLSWLKELVDWAKKYNIIIASDEGCYNEFYFESKPRSILEVTKYGVITFFSLSKRNNMTGYRIGFVAGDSRIIEGFKKLKTGIDSGSPNFIESAAITALKDDYHVELMRQEYKQKREILLKLFKNLNFEKPVSDATFYLWLKIPLHIGDDIIFSKMLLDKGIIVTPGSMIAEDINHINPGKGFVRMALVPTIDKVREAANRLNNIFK